MIKHALVVPIGPNNETHFTLWALGEIDHEPLLAHQLKRTSKNLPAGEFSFFVLCPTTSIKERVLKKLPKGLAQLELVEEGNTLAMVISWAKTHLEYNAISIVHENALWHDMSLFREMLQFHSKNRLDAIACLKAPLGLLPQMVDRRALLRLEGVGFPAEVHQNPFQLMQKANALFPGEKELNFDIREFQPKDLALEQLPPSLLINNEIAHRAACAGLSEDAYTFKQRLFEAEQQPLKWLTPPKTTQNRARILFATGFGSYSGAEKCFADTIIHLDPSRYQPIVLLPEQSYLSECLEKAGIATEVAFYPFHEPTSYSRKLCQAILHDLRIDLVHINVWAGAPLVWAAKEARIPIVTHLRTLEKTRDFPLLELSDALIGVSQASLQMAKHQGYFGQKTVCLYDGFAINEFVSKASSRDSARTKTGFSREDRLITYVARIHSQKRQEFLIRSFPALVKNVPEAKLLLVGETFVDQQDYLAKLRLLVSELGLEKSVVFMGFRSDIHEIYAMSDCSVLCAEDEAFGHLLPESIALEVPLVVPTRGAHTELFEHNRDALFFDAKNTADLAEKLSQTLLDNFATTQRIHNAKKLLGHFDIRQQMNKLESLYEELMRAAQ